MATLFRFGTGTAWYKGYLEEPLNRDVRAHDYIPWMRAHGIKVASFNELTPITKARPGPLDNILAEIAAQHQVPENAVLISWQVVKNVVVTTTTMKVARLEGYAEAV
ncbi:hypothetical protein BHYA_0189g00020 [Botrytis hyacinthi]|uniref:NADP-dependent oxidoreductase domain-containing protein n=1 Tax=Botrytis hyacinthi TaxID=278943 RepID=A0A4Z1GCV2_9HELO|nr:hypothetical protein BHYA_0189g00020 [Botrytis hyacinthi]